MIVLIFVVQLGLIFWLGSRTPICPRSPTASLTFHFGGLASPELQALNDPTLFTLPHPALFAGPVWPVMPQADHLGFEWSAPTNPFPVAGDRLSADFNRLLQTSGPPTPQLPLQPEPAPTLPNVPPLAMLGDHSILQLEGGLAQRRLLAPPELRSYTNADILAQSVVRLGVDPAGQPVSVTLLSNSGSPTADQFAMEQAWSARFEPLAHDPAGVVPQAPTQLTWGRLIFHWHTVPSPPARP